jgi:tRNA(fMet)-specific endonuclease VapC
MSQIFLLDTNAVVARLADDVRILELLDTSNEICVSSIVLGELYFGAEKSQRVQENIARVDKFTNGRRILSCDAQTARWYGRINNELRKKGKPIPQTDMWIAATALQHGLTLVTQDQHFAAVADLATISW